MSHAASYLTKLLATSPVIPVLSFDHVDQALPVAEALQTGGLKVLEITLRTDAGLPAIEKISTHFPDLLVGAGTILSDEQFELVRMVGGQFAVSPGSTSPLRQKAKSLDFPYLPGVSTLSEMMQLRAEGFHHLKLFPAETIGGLGLIKAAASVLPDITFCPTGGIQAETAPDYLAQPNIACVGGSWLVSKQDLADQNWSAITEKARIAAGLGR